MKNVTSHKLEKLIISRHQRAISVIFIPGNTYTFDPAGRPVGLYIGGRYFARALDGKMKEKSWAGAADEFDRFISDVPPQKAQALYEKLALDLRTAQSYIQDGGAVELRRDENILKGNISKTGIEILEILKGWDPKKLQQDKERFQTIYSPINILPPDQYFTIVIQVAEGCPWNKCTFCDFYKDRPFRIRTLDEIKQHIQDVAGFLGAGAALRRSIFLSDANALAVRTDLLKSITNEIYQKFPEQIEGPEGGIYTFADVPTILGKPPKELHELKNLGLRRVYIGLETGSDELRTKIAKPSTQSDAIQAAQRLKEAGLEVGIIVLLGVGGVELGPIHINQTANALNRMNLGKGDIIYFSPFTPQAKSAYVTSKDTAHLGPLTKDQIRQQFQSIKKRLHFPKNTGHPLTSVYDIREFVI
jgi:hypothetical protein